jgi:hypothetical protein
MIFQRKNKLIQIQKKTNMYYYNHEAAKRLLVPIGFALLPNKNSILLFPLSVFTFYMSEQIILKIYGGMGSSH